jgi:hypothetical protein
MWYYKSGAVYTALYPEQDTSKTGGAVAKAQSCERQELPDSKTGIPKIGGKEESQNDGRL